MTHAAPPALRCRAGDTIPLPPRCGMDESVHVIDQPTLDALDAALATGRPLLIRGEPGTGKSQIARAAARVLQRVFLLHTVDARTEPHDLLWNVDAVRRLAEAQVLGAHHQAEPNEVAKRIEMKRFLEPGVLWWAFDWSDAAAQATDASAMLRDDPDGWAANGAVVLVDEIDKADPSVPNALLDALGHNRFDAPGPRTIRADAARRPLIVITTNGDRALPEAFVRRCLVLQIQMPATDVELVEMVISRALVHLPGCPRDTLREAAVMLCEDRTRYIHDGLRPPGFAEYLDLVRVVYLRHPNNVAAQRELLTRVRAFALQKHPQDGGV